MSRSKADKAIDALVEAAYGRHGNGVQINIMDLGNIMDAGREAARSGQDIDEAVKAAIEQYPCEMWYTIVQKGDDHEQPLQ